MKGWRQRLGRCVLRSVTALLAGGSVLTAASAFEPTGTKTLTLHGRDGRAVPMGQVRFEPAADGRVRFVLKVDHGVFQDHFLSMREFKCVDGDGEIACHVPYPHAQPGTVTAQDYAWLEHALMFMVKRPSEFGAQLRNGVYFKLEPDGERLVGRPQAVDLNVIAVPPTPIDVPPYRPALRDDIPAGARWIQRLTIE